MSAAPPTAPDKQSSRARALRGFFPRAIFLLLALWSLSVWIWLAMLLPKATDISSPEGALVGSACEVAQGHSPYQDWRLWPLHFSPYGPLTYYPAGWIVRLIHPSHVPHAIYMAGRAQSFLYLLGIAALLALILRRFNFSWFASLAAPMLLTAWRDPTLTFIVSYRPDAPQIFFSILALWIALGGRATKWRTIAALLSLSVSMWFKSTSWGMIAALAFWIYQSYGIGRAVAAGALFGGINLILAFTLNWKSGGLLFLNMIASLDNGMDWRGIYTGFGPSFPWIPKIIFFASAAASIRILIAPPARATGQNPPDGRVKLLSLAVLATFLASSLQILKVGSGGNYYLEFYALGCTLLVIEVSRLWRRDQTVSHLRRAILLPSLLLAFATIGAVSEIKRTISDFPTRIKAWRPSPSLQAMENFEGNVLASLPWLVLRRPAPPTILDEVQYGILTRRGKIDERILLNKIERREFGLVLILTENIRLKNGWFPPSLLPTLDKHYRIASRGEYLTTFDPRPEPEHRE
ncbi:hypothetical protein HYR69_02925 [Candidatus Sumerlaeota bacterium]|nr:hypothetical protein [Candidatus Sumerlaeota bacterium]